MNIVKHHPGLPDSAHGLPGSAERSRDVVRMVLIEDHPAVRFAIRHMIEAEGEFIVAGEADTGGAGLDLVRARQPDMVVVDLNLPDIDGLQLLNSLASLPVPPRTLVLSGLDERIYAPRAMGLGASGFISKSKGMDELRHAIRMVAGGYICFPLVAMQVGPEGQAGEAGQPRLTRREMSVLLGLVKGQSNKEIGQTLFLSQKTISTYKIRILEKLHLETLADMINWAHRNNLIE